MMFYFVENQTVYDVLFYRETDENILGVRNLSKKLTYELVEQIKVRHLLHFIQYN